MSEIYKSLDALEPVKKVLNEADAALKDQHRTIDTSEMPEVLGALAGGAVGVGTGLTLVSVSGTVAGMSAAGITSGLAALGALVGGGMVAGIFVAAAPMALLGVGGYALISHRNKKKLAQVKEAILQEALKKHDALIRELNDKLNLSEERLAYLTALNTLLQQAIKDLQADLAQ